MAILTLVFLALVAQYPLALAALYDLTDNWQGGSFWDNFLFEAIDDPTHGRVEYVNRANAERLGLATTSDLPPHIILRADSTSKLSPTGPGRRSVRVLSQKQFGHNTVLVADILHMPQGCGTWPALWMSNGVDWPSQGEIDIVEGVNNISPNSITLHTTATCTMAPGRDQTGVDRLTDCDWRANDNAGCGVSTQKPNSYGPDFNAAGGGIYALERTPTEIKVWFWSREEIDTGRAPSGVTVPGSPSVETSQWGTPVARFTNSRCDIARKFGPENVIINLTFCGDWAGNPNVYASSGCPSTCVDYVNNQPEAFTEAYWDFKNIRMYG